MIKAPAKIVTREEWGAVPSLSVEKFRQLPYYISLTYITTGRKEKVEDEKEVLRHLQKKHMEQCGFPDIQCNFIIGSEGTLYEGRGWDVKPSLSQESTKKQRNFHGQFLEFMYLGEVSNDINASNPQLKATGDLIMIGIDKLKLPLSFKFLDDSDKTDGLSPLEGAKARAQEI